MNNDHVYEQLKLLAARIPTAYFMAIFDSDGMPGAQWIPHPLIENDTPGEEDFLVPAMGAAILSLGERIVFELGAGTCNLAVLNGDQGTIFQIVLDDEHVLMFGVREVRTIDTVPVILQQWWHPLLNVLGVSAPEL